MDCPYCNVVNYDEIPTCNKQEGHPICPHVRRCIEHHIWKPLAYMANCPIKSAPTGNVQFERHGYLYVKVDDEVIKVENPYDYIPDNVHLRKYKGTYKVVKEKENKE
uniref:Uncharacterized protein n=1 Tax=Siphoviridae sp. ct37J14 TaxID=2826280 RepID=A0A8S5M1C5_9CAUD|nr:MAG TPA: hypothetical protein [Siphoviridae sp. ct37J14]